MNIIWIILICLIVLFLVWVITISVVMSGRLSNPKHKTYEFTINRSKNEEHSYGDFDSYAKEAFDVTLHDGYVIHGDIYPLDPKKVVIISHGHGDNKYTGIRFLQTFRNLGYTTVIYDLRGHGENAPHVCTMGLNESKDLIEILEAVRKRFPGAVIGLHGLSMGCATSVMALKYKPDIDFLVADCGYGILKDICYSVLQSIKAPKWMFYPVNWTNQLRFGYNAGRVNPIDSLVDNEVPVLFIHGAADDYIDCRQSEWMYELDKGSKKELHFIPDAGHAQSWNHDPAEYEKIISNFLDKYVKNDKRFGNIAVSIPSLRKEF